MRWRRLPRDPSQVDDRRGRSGGFAGGGTRIPGGRAGGGIGLAAILLLVVASCMTGGNFLTGGNDNSGFEGFGLEPLPPAPSATPDEPIESAPDPARDFVIAVSGDIQRMWSRTFRAAGVQYRPSQIVLFSGATRGGCGPASAATGPFYCTLDGKIYIDLGFFSQLSRRFGAPGDFAQAYVIAHEYGHHVQNLLGINGRMQRLTREEPRKRNELSVRMELQADCFAGVWAHSAYQAGLLEPGDVEEGLGAAGAVGDDRIQATTTGRVNPETWTHGSSDQRREWFTRGLESGDPNVCDTFSGKL
jgi:predicted metalloprotease